jgi:hypothetical protein
MDNYFIRVMISSLSSSEHNTKVKPFLTRCVSFVYWLTKAILNSSNISGGTSAHSNYGKVRNTSPFFDKGVRKHPYGATSSTGSLKLSYQHSLSCLVPENPKLKPNKKLLRNVGVKLILYVVE